MKNTDALVELAKEYRPTMTTDVLHDWAQELVAKIRSEFDPDMRG